MRLATLTPGTVLMCNNCKERGKERTFRTYSGYRSHLEGYHRAPPDAEVRLPMEPDDDERPRVWS